MGSPPRFLVDAMLGNVARDLRLLGLDAEFLTGVSDSELLRRAQRHRRILVTRDQGLAARARGICCVLVREPDPQTQIEEVLRWVPATAVAPFTRCLECNSLLERISKDDATPLVPDHVAAAHERFSACPRCGRVYWPGSHTRRLSERAEHLRSALLRSTPRL